MKYSEHISYGDLVTFAGFARMRNSNQRVRGYMSATGYSMEEVYLQQLQIDKYEINAGDDFEVNTVNYRDFVFQM